MNWSGPARNTLYNYAGDKGALILDASTDQGPVRGTGSGVLGQ
ncbi:hypothetical protein ACEZCY_28565 [Streptacidiphilus sp. N1-12]|uniref:Uncharacterized protein n=2 Tax=Streptacidiphilus alkalitolerans TaxID=3342712 RepID=A0ABV6WM88_9ACTN